MAAGAAGALRHRNKYIYGSAAPAREPYQETYERPVEIDPPFEQTQQRGRQKSKISVSNKTKKETGVSLFAILGTLVVTSLMIFVMLAQINLNELSRETTALTSRLDELTQQQRVLAISFENVVNMKEIERYAKDVLGMSKPEAEQSVVIRTLPADKVEIFVPDESKGGLQEFGSFLTYLFDEYIR